MIERWTLRQTIRIVMAAKASIYQAQGNLQEAAKLLSEINAQTPSRNSFRNQDHSVET